jgi:hypothetical protein
MARHLASAYKPMSRGPALAMGMFAMAHASAYYHRTHMPGAQSYHVGTQSESMAVKPARLTLLIDADKKKAFEALCASQDITASQVVRQLIREYLAKHGVTSTYASTRSDASNAPAG